MEKKFKLPGLVSLLLFNGSRKVGAALWLFITAHLLLIFKYITSGDWLASVMASVALIGGGTVADAFLARKSPPKPDED